MTATLPHLSVIHGDRHDPPEADPVMAELIDAIRETWYEAGCADTLAAMGTAHRSRPRRPARAGARPDYLRAVGS